MDSKTEDRFAEWASFRIAGLHRFAYLLCGDWHVAEDLVQDALAKTALKWKRIEATEHPDAYVRKILINGNRGLWRSRSSRPDTISSQVESHAIELPDSTDMHATRDELMTALRQLPARQRAAIVLRYFEDHTEAETAEILGCSVGTVKSQTSKAIGSLRRAMATEELSC